MRDELLWWLLVAKMVACRCWKGFLGSFLFLTSCFISHFGFGSFNLLVLPFPFSHFFLSHTLFSNWHQLNFQPKTLFFSFSLLRFFVVSSFFSHFLFLPLLISPFSPSCLVLSYQTLFFLLLYLDIFSLKLGFIFSYSSSQEGWKPLEPFLVEWLLPLVLLVQSQPSTMVLHFG
jgi:hypothetical protein